MANPSNPATTLGGDTNSPVIDSGTNMRSESRPQVIAGAAQNNSLSKQLSRSLTPEEMWKLVQNRRGYESSTGGKGDRLRGKPSTIKIDPKRKGSPIGKGYETFGSIQVIDKNGKRVDVGVDQFIGGSKDQHAERKVLRALENNIKDTVPGGKLIVVVEKEPCSTCRPAIEKFAKTKKLSSIDVYVPERTSMTNPDKMVTSKTAARSSFQGGRPKLRLKKLYTIKVPGGFKMYRKSPLSGVKITIRGTIASLVAGVVLGILTNKFHDNMLKDLKNAKKPTLDPKTSNQFFSSPNAKASLSVIDVLTKNLRPFISQLEKHHQSTIIGTNLTLAALAIASEDELSEQGYLEALTKELDIYERELFIVLDNVEAALALEPHLLELVKNSDELHSILSRVVVADYLLQMGLKFEEEYLVILRNFRSYSSNIKKVINEFKAFEKVLVQYIEEIGNLASDVNSIGWNSFFEALKSIDQ